MRADRFDVRLIRGSSERLRMERFIDPFDYAAVRELLEDMVTEREGRGRINLTGYRLDIHHLRHQARIARVTIDRSGRTLIDGKPRELSRC
jgi:CelD/BcsL family acetyltransferase involved in cellulose biosynthesis